MNKNSELVSISISILILIIIVLLAINIPFFLGVFDGYVIIVKFIFSVFNWQLFGNNLMYDATKGLWYDFGFIIGISTIFNNFIDKPLKLWKSGNLSKIFSLKITMKYPTKED